MSEVKPRLSFSLKSAYLVAYNSLAFCVWALVGYVLVRTYYHGSPETMGSAAWDSISIPLGVAQTLGLMEILHSYVGFTRSNFSTTAMQIFSRLHIIYLIWRLVPESRDANVLGITVTAWTAAELIRYSYYVSQIAFRRHEFYLLTWLRYSVFLFAYPIGILGEMWSIWVSLSHLRVNRSLRTYPWPMPNRLNFEMDLFIVYCFILPCYIPGGVLLYTHMLKRREKVLNTSSNASCTETAKKTD